MLLSPQPPAVTCYHDKARLSWEAMAACQASLALPPVTLGQTGQVGFPISSSLPCLSGDCLHLCVCLCVTVCVSFCDCVCAWLCVLVYVSSRLGRQGGPCGFGPRQLVSRQWLQPPTWEGCRPDT